MQTISATQQPFLAGNQPAGNSVTSTLSLHALIVRNAPIAAFTPTAVKRYKNTAQAVAAHQCGWITRRFYHHSWLVYTACAVFLGAGLYALASALFQGRATLAILNSAISDPRNASAILSTLDGAGSMLVACGIATVLLLAGQCCLTASKECWRLRWVVSPFLGLDNQDMPLTGIMAMRALGHQRQGQDLDILIHRLGTCRLLQAAGYDSDGKPVSVLFGWESKNAQLVEKGDQLHVAVPAFPVAA